MLQRRQMRDAVAPRVEAERAQALAPLDARRKHVQPGEREVGPKPARPQAQDESFDGPRLAAAYNR